MSTVCGVYTLVGLEVFFTVAIQRYPHIPPTQVLADTVHLKSNRGVYAWVIHLQKLTPQAALRESLAEPVSGNPKP